MKKTTRIEVIIGIILLFWVGVALAAEAPKSEATPPVPTVESLTADNAALKGQNAALTKELNDLKKTYVELQQSYWANMAAMLKMQEAAQAGKP